ncbi:hypothetical protein [Streptomyces sp. ME19-01-6]|nr:hypothetical protein [Streptomyces sp. ME19-01-6]MDX3231374.1 hypothetical protein [Streptomyces sp. ME19-01-6]
MHSWSRCSPRCTAGIPLTVYMRLARTEERELAKRFGEQWTAYAAQSPAF